MRHFTIDIAYGVLWYRVLVGHVPLDEAAARDLAACLIAAGNPARTAHGHTAGAP